MFGFFLQTEQTFKLPSHAAPLKNYPQMCSAGSVTRPDLIPSRSQVIPCLTKASQSDRIPLFVPMKIQNNHLEPTSLELSTKFCLMFYPDPEYPPQNDPLIREYWKSIQPMIICRDMSGYYLGNPEDSHKVFFELKPDHKHNSEMATPYIRQAVADYNELLAYGKPEFASKHIYLHRHSIK